MWKKVAVLGTSACGLRLQIQDNKDGRLTMNPTNPEEIAENLTQMLTKPKLLEKWGRSAQKTVYQKFLVFSQIEKWLNCISQVVN
jgi:trehalose synthase